MLSVQHSVGPPIPAFLHFLDDPGEIPSFAGGKDAGHILPDAPGRITSASKAKKLEGQVTTRVIHASSPAGDGERLTGGSPNEKVNWSGLDLGEISDIIHSWPPL